MNDAELERKLNSVGRRVFVECFYIFKKYAYNQKRCVRLLMEKYPDKAEGEANRCASNAKLIVQAGKECKAIVWICENSQNLSRNTIEQAMEILREYRQIRVF